MSASLLLNLPPPPFHTHTPHPTPHSAPCRSLPRVKPFPARLGIERHMCKCTLLAIQPHITFLKKGTKTARTIAACCQMLQIAMAYAVYELH